MRMKRTTSLLCAAMLLCALCGCHTATEDGAKTDDAAYTWLNPQTTANDPYGTSYETLAQADGLTLSMNPDTTDIRLTVDATGYTWSTAARKETDTASYPILYMDYTSDDGLTGVMDTTNDSISKGQYRIEKLENGAKVSYTMGDIAVDYIYPTSLTPERYDFWYAKCATPEQQETLFRTYTLLDISFYDDETQAIYNERYPHAVGGMIYGLRHPTMTDVEKADISQLMATIGYTKEDLATDHTEYTPHTGVNTTFNVSVYYTLENGGLQVRVPEQEIQYADTFHIQYLTVLQNFTGGVQDSGYLLLPDGSGSLMYFGNGKQEQAGYRTAMYGTERTISVQAESTVLENACLPVFGCVEGQNGYLAVVRDADTLAYVNATPGSSEATARVWPDFRVEARDSDTLANTIMVFGDMELPVYQKDRYTGSFELLYTFFSGKEANYSHMAAFYSDYLFGDAALLTPTGYPLSAEMIGTVDVQEKLFGFSYSDKVTLTDAAQLQEIATDLKGSGVDALDVTLSGWFGEGYRNGVVSGELPVLSDMGGDEGLATAIAALQKQDIPVSLEAEVQYAYAGAGGVNNSLISRLVNEAVAKLYPFDLDTFAQNKNGISWYILNPTAICNGIAALSERAKALGAAGITLRSTGQDLNADYHPKNTTDRQDAKAQICAALQKAAETGALTVGGSNGYVLTLADRVASFPVNSNRQDMTNESIPFLAMVASGHVRYTAAPLNLSNTNRLQLLRMIESNAGAAAVFTAGSCTDLGVGDYANLYASCYTEQKDRVLAAYEYLQGALADTYGQTIVAHRILQKGVAMTTFSSGKWIIVNYTESPVTIGKLTVPAQDYRKGGN